MAMGTSHGLRLFIGSVFAICFSLVTVVAAADLMPQILDLSYRPAPFDAGSGIKVVPKMLGGDNANVEYFCRWFVNEEEVEDLHDTLLPGDYFERGDLVSVEVTPELNGQQGAPVKSGVVGVGNASPQIVSSPPQQFVPGLFNYEVQVVDADDDSLVFSLLEAPTGMQLDRESGLLTWLIEVWQEELVGVSVQVEDGFGGKDVQQFKMNLSFVQRKGQVNE